MELVGSRRGLDAELLAEAGLPVRLLPGRGFVRRLSPGAAASNVIAVAELAVAVILAFVLVGRRRPAVVVAMGGYASVAGSVAAVLWRVPVVLVNVDAVPGAANRLIGRFARAAAVAFPGTALPRAVVTGAPVRPEIADAAHPDAASRLEARRALGLPEGGQVIGAVGGSLGAARINEALLELARLWADRTDVALYHVVGRRDYQWVAAAGSGAAGAALRYVQVAYEERMALFYRASDVVVCRAGANTVAELAVVGVPAVLVPLPGAPGDHQSANARALAQAGAAVILADDACTGARLADVLEDMLGDPGRLEAMATAGAALGRPDAVEAVAAVVEAEARK